MLIRKAIWNGIVAIAILFLIFMFGYNHGFGPSPAFASMPAAPALSDVQLKTVAPAIFPSTKIQNPLDLKKIPFTGTSQRLIRISSSAVAWVVQIAVSAQPTNQWVTKLQNQKWPAFVYPQLSPHAMQFIFIGPYVHRRDAERAAQALKNTFGLAGDVVKFNPLVM